MTKEECNKLLQENEEAYMSGRITYTEYTNIKLDLQDYLASLD